MQIGIANIQLNLSILLPTFRCFTLLTKALQSWHGFFKDYTETIIKISYYEHKFYS